MMNRVEEAFLIGKNCVYPIVTAGQSGDTDP